MTNKAWCRIKTVILRQLWNKLQSYTFNMQNFMAPYLTKYMRRFIFNILN